jgi:mannose/fructose/N-acetylgalactosamine-specific phosphotransferase system component IIB
MMKKNILGFLIIVFLIAIPIKADIYLVNKQHTEGMAVMGKQQADQDVIQKVWITKDKIKSESEDQTIFILMNEKKIIALNHENKTYTELPIGLGNMMDKAMENQKDVDKEEMEQFMQMAKGMMKFEIKVTPTSETKKINKWQCKKYNQEVKMGMGPINSEVWATEELEMDYEVYAQFSTAMMSMQPGFSDSFDKAMTELKKIKGVPVFTETTMNMMGMQMKTTQELLEFKRTTAPKGTFDIPKGYKKTDMMGGN